MEQEKFFSGYCRNTDESRMVCVVKEDGILSEVDCSYECCPFAKECTISKEITDFLCEANA